MGAGCSTESPQTATYEKSQVKEETTKRSQGRNRDRKQSGASTADGAVKTKKSRASVQLQHNPLSK
ncbi:unnamed protein product, partial [Candidula unifasciata]